MFRQILKSSCFAFIFFMLVIGQVLAQVNVKITEAEDFPFYFYRPGEKEDLNLSPIQTIVKDQKGNLWLGTTNGIFQFDGIHLRAHRQNLRTDGLKGGFNVNCASIGPDGKVWFGTEAGLCYFDPVQQRIFNKIYKSVDIPSKMDFDTEGNLFVYDFNSLKLITSKGNVYDLKQIKGFSNYIENGDAQVRWLKKDPDGKGIWIQTIKGLLHVWFHKNQVEIIPEPIFQKLESYGPGTAVFHNKKVFWWVSHNKHILQKIDFLSGKVMYNLSLPQAFDPSGIDDLLEDQGGNIWFVNRRRRNWVYHKEKQKFLNLVHNPKKAGGFPSVRVTALYENNDGSVWMATEDGLVATHPQKEWLKLIPFFNSGDTSKFKKRIHSLEAALGYWWIGCTNGELIRLNPKSGEMKHYFIDDKLIATEGNKAVLGIYSLHYSFGKMLVGTRKGMLHFFPNEEKWKVEPSLSGPEWQGMIYSLTPENDSIVWVKMHSKGLNRLNTKSLTWKHFGNQNDFDLVADMEWSLANPFIGPGGKVYLDNFEFKKLALYNEEKKAFYYLKDIHFGKRNPSAYSYVTTSNKKDKIWQIVYPMGLFEIDARTGNARQVEPATKGDFRYFKAFLYGKDGKLWLADQNVIGFLDPKTNRYTVYQLNLGSMEHNYDTRFKQLDDGRILVSSYYELVIVDPKILNKNEKIPTPFVSNISNDANTIRYESTGKELLFKPDENSMNFEIGLLTPDLKNYIIEYKIDNLVEAWTPVGRSGTLRFLNVKDGDYTLRLRNRSRYNHWLSDVYTQKFSVAPHFYNTWWFWTLLLGLIAALVYLYVKSKWVAQAKLFALETKALTLEREKTIVQYESLKQQLNPHFLFNSLTSLASLIRINPKLAGEFLDSMSKSYRYILKSQDHELVPLADEIKFIQTFLKLQKVRFEDAIQIEIDLPEEKLHYKIVPVTLQNLVENAIKHNIVDTDSPLSIRIYAENDYLVVQNNLQKKGFVETSNKQGLNNIKLFYKYLDNRPILIDESDGFFRIKIPLI